MSSRSYNGPPPRGFEIVFQFHAERSVIIEALHPSVDLRALKYESSAFTKTYQRFHRCCCHIGLPC